MSLWQCPFYLDEFEFHKGREDSCPLPCTETSFSYMLTDVRFLHNPPQGFDERLVKKKLQRKPFLNNRIHDLYLSFNDTARFGDYIEYAFYFFFLFIFLFLYLSSTFLLSAIFPFDY